jgi:hypothetical protein
LRQRSLLELVPAKTEHDTGQCVGDGTIEALIHHGSELIVCGRGENHGPGRPALHQAGLPGSRLINAAREVVHHHGAGFKAGRCCRRRERGSRVDADNRDDRRRTVAHAGLPQAGQVGDS